MSKKIHPIQDSIQFSGDDVDVVSRERVYDGFFKMEQLRLKHRLFDGGWGPEISRELLGRGPAVAAVLYDPERDLIGLVEQFRVGCLNETHGPWTLEVVAGILDCGGTPEQAMLRELQEEADIQPEALRYICNYLPSPGGCDEKLHLYCALADLSAGGGLYGLVDEGEDIRFCVYPAENLLADVYSGRMNNAATLICLQWLQLNRAALRAEFASAK